MGCGWGGGEGQGGITNESPAGHWEAGLVAGSQALGFEEGQWSST